ncbi:transcriptional regulator [Paraneptunicella aestuarii]|uniref:sigma-E factor negative regulatory protein n=1 Tax=Paraneptunicella aestuarii TaxID=2831148 RepID=UPI001E31A1C8|nr:RseA family anti-sigma factor [Paraneptunicella aestuarii]UAA40070.1 transcriptional regulator [Paraneptunicella aestuarii]
MTQRKIESLSAYIDGDHQDGKFLEELRSDPELISKWHRYHIIKDGLKNELPTELHLDLSDSIAKAIEKEPVIMAPKPSLLKSFFGKGSKGSVTPLVQQTGQFAIAATVAVAVILGYQQYNTPVAEQPFSATPVIPVSGIQGGLSPVSLEQTRSLPGNDVMEQRRRLNAYLNDHNQQVRRKSNVEPNSNTPDDASNEGTNKDSGHPDNK